MTNIPPNIRLYLEKQIPYHVLEPYLSTSANKNKLLEQQKNYINDFIQEIQKETKITLMPKNRKDIIQIILKKIPVNPGFVYKPNFTFNNPNYPNKNLKNVQKLKEHLDTNLNFLSIDERPLRNLTIEEFLNIYSRNRKPQLKILKLIQEKAKESKSKENAISLNVNKLEAILETLKKTNSVGKILNSLN